MNRNIAIFAGVFAFLLVAVLVMQARPKSSGVKELKVATIDKEKVTQIDVTLPGKDAKEKTDTTPAQDAVPEKHITLKKSGESWTVSQTTADQTATPAYAVEDGQIRTALDAVAEFKTGDLINNKNAKLADFEIDDKHGHHVKVVTSSGDGLDLIFGRAAKGGGSTVRQAGSDDVYVAKGRLGAVLKKDAAAWRKKTIIDTKAEDVTRVTMKAADGAAIAIEAVPGTPAPDAAEGAPPPKPTYKLVEPQTLPADFRLDDSAVQRVVQSVVSLRAQDFADGVADDATGLALPHATIDIAARDGKTTTVHLGKEDDKKRVFVRKDGDAQVYLVSSFSTKNAVRTLDDLRDMSLLSGTIADIASVTLSGFGAGASQKVVVKREGEAFQLVEPKTAPQGFDVTQIESQVQGLLRTKAVRLAKGQAMAGKGPSIELVMKDGKKQRLVLGAGVPDPEAKPAADGKMPEPREFLATGGLDNLTYVVSGYIKTRFEKPYEMFKTPPPPPQGMGGMNGLDSLPPDIRKKLEASMKQAQP